MYYFFPLRSKVAKINLSIAFKNKDNKEINTILKNTYKHFGKLIIEFIRMHTIRLDNTIIKFDKKYENHLLSDNGVIFMTAHFGNWEVITSLLHKYKHITAIARQQKNNGGNKFFNESRLLDNVTLISNKGSKRKMLRTLIDKKILLIASDQNAKAHGTYIDFFGKQKELKAEGLLATCIQHEVDHLDGILFIDYLSKLKKDMIIKKLVKHKKEIERIVV